jgi:holliday junction resolvase YEN1
MQKGLVGCGLPTAISLARGGYGTTLVDGIRRHSSSTAIAAFLATWRATLVEELRTNRSGFLHKCLPVIAKAVPLDFPDLHIINLYLSPLTSQSRLHQGAVAIIAQQGPDLVRLARFVEDHFTWGDLAGILKRFSTCVFPGLALQELLAAAHDMDLGLQPKLITMVGKIHGL